MTTFSVGPHSTALVLSILKGETTAVEAARRHNLAVADIERWRDTFLLVAENLVCSRSEDEEALRDRSAHRRASEVADIASTLLADSVQ